MSSISAKRSDDEFAHINLSYFGVGGGGGWAMDKSSLVRMVASELSPTRSPTRKQMERETQGI